MSMADFEKKSENIDRYLADEMTSSERSAFESEIRSNQKLQNTVNLRKEMGAFFSKGGDDLLEKLKAAGEQQFAPSHTASTSMWKWLLAILAVVLAAMAAYWFSKSDQNNIAPVQKDDAVIKPMPIATDTQVVGHDTVLLSPDKPSEKKASQPEQKPARKPAKQQSPVAVPIAQANPADFSPNPYLEEIIGDQLRSVIELSVDSPQPGDTMSIAIKENGLPLAGTLNQEMKLTYALYDNKEESFFNEKPLASGELATSLKAEKYTFSRRIKAAFKPGRYYLLLFNSADEEMLDARTFIVEN